MSVFQITSLEGVDLSLQVGEIVRDLGATSHQLGELLSGVNVGDALLCVAGHDAKICEVVAWIFLNIKEIIFINHKQIFWFWKRLRRRWKMPLVSGLFLKLSSLISIN